MNKTSAIILLAAGLLAGCGGERGASERRGETPRESDEREATGTGARQIVEGVTGIQSLRSGRKAQDQVRQIQADYDRKMQEALEANE